MTELLDGIDALELRGRRQKKLSAVAVRPLTEADIAVLQSGERAPARQGTLQKLRDRHHMVARLMAGGKTNSEISLITGMDPARISVLKSDPAFKELLSDYRKIAEGIEAEMHDRLHMLGMTVVEEIQDRIENAEEPIPLTTLLEVGKFTTDRVGHGPVTKVNNLNVNVDLSNRLASARKRIAPPTDAEFTVVEPGSSPSPERKTG